MFRPCSPTSDHSTFRCLRGWCFCVQTLTSTPILIPSHSGQKKSPDYRAPPIEDADEAIRRMHEISASIKIGRLPCKSDYHRYWRHNTEVFDDED